MSGCFVRGLFGDELVDGYSGLLSDIKARVADKLKPEPCLWYAWGGRNAEILRSSGFEPIVCSSDPIPRNGFNGEPDYISGFGVRPFGWNIYRLKFDAIRAAQLAGYTHVVWLDMDVQQIRLLPERFWGTLATGQPLQAPLVQYHRVQAGWRKRCPRTSIYCATCYWRGVNIVEECIAYARQHPRAFEQEAMNFAIDRLAGGEFPGHDEYRAVGFEFPFTERKGGMIHEPILPVFRIGSKGWSSFKRSPDGRTLWKQHVANTMLSRVTSCSHTG